jgi:phosphoglycolate phosphatase
MMAKVKLVIFDLDGTLIDAYPGIIKSFNHTMGLLGYPTQRDLIIRRAVGWGDKRLLEPFIKTKDLNKALKIYRGLHKKYLMQGSRLLPQVKNLLSYLKTKGYKLAVASNRPTRFSLFLMRHLKIIGYFDYILCADKLKRIKPHPQILNKIRQRFGLLPEEMLYVGDMVIDIQAGRRAKVKTIAVTSGSHSRLELSKEKPFAIFSCVKDLKKIL